MTCDQKGKGGRPCGAPAVQGYRWPGRKDDGGVCREHLPKLLEAAQAKGFPLPLLPIPAKPSTEKP